MSDLLALSGVNTRIGHYHILQGVDFVVPQGGLMFRDDVEVHRVLGGPQFGELALGHGQPKFRLGFGQGDPEPPPHPLAEERRQQAHHGLAGVAAGQGMLESLQFRTVVGRKEGHKNSGPPVSHGLRDL